MKVEEHNVTTRVTMLYLIDAELLLLRAALRRAESEPDSVARPWPTVDADALRLFAIEALEQLPRVFG